MKRILFVDDEPKILRGLQRMLRPMRTEWEVAFATGGQEALDLMAQRPFDVIVSDMRMPGMNGVQLLDEVKARHPDTVRIVLSGQSDRELTLKAMGPTHQYLTKPCDADVLQQAIARAFELRRILSDEPVRRLVCQTTSVPSLPAIYYEIQKELESAETSIQRIGSIIAQDVSMSAKILQVANSALFATGGAVATPTEAIFRLGLDTIRALVVSVHAFTSFSPRGLKNVWLASLWSHSIAAGALAKQIAKQESRDARLVDHAFTGGLLHDLGKVVLAANIPDRYRRVIAVSQTDHLTVWEAEQATLGATHAQVGAYLLGLWGLSDQIVEALAYHHCPGEYRSASFSAVTAVHVANILEQEGRPVPDGPRRSELDIPYLESIGMRDRLEEWRELCCTPVQGGA